MDSSVKKSPVRKKNGPVRKKNEMKQKTLLQSHYKPQTKKIYVKIMYDGYDSVKNVLLNIDPLI